MPDCTPGQTAYEAYAAARFPDAACPIWAPYAHLSHTAQRAWEAAAQAVLAMQAPTMTLREARRHALALGLCLVDLAEHWHLEVDIWLPVEDPREAHRQETR